MKISNTSIALALAALTPLCALRSAAEEPAWAAAPTEANALLTAIGTLRTRVVQTQAAQAPAEAAPASAPEKVWQKILDAVRKNGKYTPEVAPIRPGVFGLKGVQGDEKADHSIQYADVLGALNDDGLFAPMAVVFTSEDWKVDPTDGLLHGDRWLIQADLYGTVQDAFHGEVVEAADGKQHSAEPDKLDPSDPVVAEKFKAMIEYWAAKP
jgi:hypothetical protein